MIYTGTFLQPNDQSRQFQESTSWLLGTDSARQTLIYEFMLKKCLFLDDIIKWFTTSIPEHWQLHLQRYCRDCQRGIGSNGRSIHSMISKISGPCIVFSSLPASVHRLSDILDEAQVAQLQRTQRYKELLQEYAAAASEGHWSHSHEDLLFFGSLCPRLENSEDVGHRCSCLKRILLKKGGGIATCAFHIITSKAQTPNQLVGTFGFATMKTLSSPIHLFTWIIRAPVVAEYPVLCERFLLNATVHKIWILRTKRKEGGGGRG